MSRKSGRRVKVKQTIRYYDSTDSDGSDDSSSWLELFAMAVQHSKRKKTRAAGTARKQTTPRKTQKRSNVSKKSPSRHDVTVTVPLTPAITNDNITDSINLDDSVIADQSKKVENKVESFFKAHNLISDDEDEGVNHCKKSKYPSKDTKEFYEISDSDDDTKLPSTSHSGIIQSSEPSSSVLEISDIKHDEVTEIVDSESHKEEELMDIVDQILENTDKNTDLTTEKDQSWTDYKKKAEEILGSISNILGEYSKGAEPKTVKPDPPKQESPKAVKPSCPVCFDILGGDIPAMATTCGHIFCKTCIQHVAKTSKKCPTCRKTVRSKIIHPIYL